MKQANEFLKECLGDALPELMKKKTFRILLFQKWRNTHMSAGLLIIVISSHHSFGLSGIILSWVKRGMKEPPDQMSGILVQIVKPFISEKQMKVL